MTSNNDRSFVESFLVKHYEWQEKRFNLQEGLVRRLVNDNKLLADRVSSLEDVLTTHTQKSVSNNQKLNLLVSGVFFSFFLLILLGTTVEGSIGTSKIAYSSNGFLSTLISLVSLGGGGVALAPVVKSYLQKK